MSVITSAVKQGGAGTGHRREEAQQAAARTAQARQAVFLTRQAPRAEGQLSARTISRSALSCSHSAPLAAAPPCAAAARYVSQAIDSSEATSMVGSANL